MESAIRVELWGDEIDGIYEPQRFNWRGGTTHSAV